MRNPRTLSGLATCLLLLVAVLHWIWSINDYFGKLSYFEAADSLKYLRWFEIGMGGVVLGWSIKPLLKGKVIVDVLRFRSSFALRIALYGFVAAVSVTSILVGAGLLPISGTPTSAFFYSGIGIMLMAWYHLVIHFTPQFQHAPKSIAGHVDVVLINIVASAIAIEFVLRQVANWAPGPFLYDSSSVAARIQAYRIKPGRQYFDFRHNSLGYYDDEFFKATDDDFLVAVISDSFGQGIVPHSHNFTTVAERILRNRLEDKYKRIAVHNFGTASIGMREYLFILENDVLPTNPDLVVLSVFVGNDIVDEAGQRKSVWKVFQSWWLFELPRRYFLSVSEGRDDYWEPKMPTDVPPHINDPDKESPTYSKERYLVIERARADVCDPGSSEVAKYFGRFFKILDEIVLKTQGRIMILVIPDEYQVNDALYEEVLAGKKNRQRLERDYPQKRIAEYCRGNGLDCLDLLPVLRDANREERVYHRRNTHWNAAGNRIAGEAIAEHILSGSP